MSKQKKNNSKKCFYLHIFQVSTHCNLFRFDVILHGNYHDDAFRKVLKFIQKGIQMCLFHHVQNQEKRKANFPTPRLHLSPDTKFFRLTLFEICFLL